MAKKNESGLRPTLVTPEMFAKLETGFYVLPIDVENPRPWAGRRSWYDDKKWSAGTVFVVKKVVRHDGERERLDVHQLGRSRYDRVSVFPATERPEGNDVRWHNVVAAALEDAQKLAPTLGEFLWKEDMKDWTMEATVAQLVDMGKISWDDIRQAKRRYDEMTEEETTAFYERHCL